MDVFYNCRICLGDIDHEPIKMTRAILRFLERCLQFPNIIKPYSRDSLRQNLCAPCFNRLTEFQDFHEQCKESDEFWKAQFEELKETHPENQIFVETIVFPFAEDSSSLEADTTVSTTQMKSLCFVNAENDGHVHSPQINVELDRQDNEEKELFLLASSQIKSLETKSTRTESFNNTDLTNWRDETNDEDGEIQSAAHIESDENTKNITEEIVEYEYNIENEEIKAEEISIIDESASSDTNGTDYRTCAFEKIEPETSSKRTIIRKTNKKALEEHSEGTENFVLTTTLDENGKVKTIYKCLHCDKIFNRIYDIESHCNIHNGVKPFTCNVCGKSFRQKNILTTHQALHFGKKVECGECGKKFARRSQLTLHNRMHRGEKPFVCNFDECSAAFRQKKQLIDHYFIHTGEKNFQCTTCTKSFHTRKRLQDHLYKVHSQHRYRCELCEKTFLKPHMLKHHMTTAHNIELDDVSHLKTLIDVQNQQ